MEIFNREPVPALTELQKRVLTLRDENYNFKEIARQLNITIKQTKEIHSLATLRLNQHTAYNLQKRADEPVVLSLSRGELKLVLEALIMKQGKDYGRLKARYKHLDDFSVTDYEFDIVNGIIDRVEEILKINVSQKIIDALDKPTT